LQVRELELTYVLPDALALVLLVRSLQEQASLVVATNEETTARGCARE
jgi:hypothetical protein